jgi:transposase
MLRDCTSFRRVIVCCGRVDLRMGIDGLAAYVKLNYGLEPFEKGTLFLFCGRRTDRIKGLVFEGDGSCLILKRLSPGNRFQWPRTPDEAREISSEQCNRLMSGFTLDSTIREVFPMLNKI